MNMSQFGDTVTYKNKMIMWMEMNMMNEWKWLNKEMELNKWISIYEEENEHE